MRGRFRAGGKYSFTALLTSNRNSSLQPSVRRFMAMLALPGCCLSSESVKRLSQATFLRRFSSRMLGSSSRKVRSRHECNVFSIAQWLRICPAEDRPGTGRQADLPGLGGWAGSERWHPGRLSVDWRVQRTGTFSEFHERDQHRSNMKLESAPPAMRKEGTSMPRRAGVSVAGPRKRSAAAA